jgi:hypothetical protein
MFRIVDHSILKESSFKEEFIHEMAWRWQSGRGYEVRATVGWKILNSDNE